MNPSVCLTMAGTDSGGAAGIAADLATFAAHGAHGACVVTAVTAQDTTGVHDVHPVPPADVEAQLDAVLTDLPVTAVKTGMLGSPETVRLVADRIAGMTLVVDPVLVATSGAILGDDQVVAAYREHLLGVATVITPNADEAQALLGTDGPRADVARRLSGFGCAVILTGGSTESATCTDWLAIPGCDPMPLTHPAIRTGNDHGTGCTFSAALAAQLAHRRSLADAARLASSYTAQQLQLSQHWTLGRGRGPIAHTTGETA